MKHPGGGDAPGRSRAGLAKMAHIMTGGLLALGIAALGASGAIGLTAVRMPDGAAPMLVVTAPWGDGAAEIVARAGGRPIGPVEAPLAVFAEGASAAAFRAAGAIAVLPASALSFLCEGEQE